MGRGGVPVGGCAGRGRSVACVTAAGARRGRRCSRTGCSRPAISTLTYVYADSTAVLGPLATVSEPHSYDLCAEHATRLTAPQGWDVVRLGNEEDYQSAGPGPDDLIALADAVREAGRRRPAAAEQPPPPGATGSTGLRRGHLRIVGDDRP